MGAFSAFPAWAAVPAAGGVMAVAVAGALAWRAASLDNVSPQPAKTPLAVAAPPIISPAPVAATIPPKPIEPAQKVEAPPTVAPVQTASLEPAPAPPTFDVVRVEPSGDAVVAGRGAPGTRIAVVEGEKVLAEEIADKGGQFVALLSGLKSGDHDLHLRMTSPAKPAVVSSQNVTVVVADKSKGGVIVALSEPGAATKVISDPAPAPGKPATTTPAPKPQANNTPPSAGALTSPPKPAPKETAAAAPPAEKPVDQNTIVARLAPAPEAPKTAEARPVVSIRTAEIEEGGGFYATGSAPAGGQLRLYLNGTFVTGVKASDAGQWSLKIGHGLTPGAYAIRADHVHPDDGSVIARAEVPFEFPAQGEGIRARLKTSKKSLAAKSVPAKVEPSKAAVAAAKPAPEPAVALERPTTPPVPAPVAPALEPVPPAPAATIAGATSSPAPRAAATIAIAPPAPALEPVLSTPTAPIAITKSAPSPKAAVAPTIAIAPPPAPEPALPAPIAVAKSAPPPIAAPAPVASPPLTLAPSVALPSPTAAQVADAVVPHIQTTTVIRGDSLWRISRKSLGKGHRYTLIYEANSKQIRDPRLIYPGQVFVLPNNPG